LVSEQIVSDLSSGATKDGSNPRPFGPRRNDDKDSVPLRALPDDLARFDAVRPVIAFNPQCVMAVAERVPHRVRIAAPEFGKAPGGHKRAQDVGSIAVGRLSQGCTRAERAKGE
jgi:hypothetical protein